MLNFLETRLCLLLVFGLIQLSRTAPNDAVAQFHNRKGIHECDTPVCIDAASSIKKHLDPTANPCDNFYKFACGRYLKEAVIPDDRSQVSVFDDLTKRMQKQLKTSMEKGMSNDDPRTFHLLKTYYDVCMNTEQIEKTGGTDLEKIFKDLGGWPVLEGQSWNESNFDWINLIHKLKEKGYSFKYFFQFDLGVDERNSSRYIIHIDQTKLGLYQPYLVKGIEEKVVQAYKNLIVDVAEIFGSDRKNADTELAEALDFEIALAKISLPDVERHDPSKLYNLMTIEKLQSKYPLISWIEYFNNLLAPYAQVTPTDEVVVGVPSFFEDFFKLIKNTPKRVLANYVFYRVALDSSSYLSERVRQAMDNFKMITVGTTARRQRWEECIDYITNYSTKRLEIAVGALYVDRHVDAKVKDDVSKLIESIRQSYKRIITEITWMDKKTKEAALLKLDQIIPFAAHPEEFRDHQKIDNYYKDLRVYPESFLRSHLSLNLFNYGKEFEKLRTKADRTDWMTHDWVAVVNAAYQPSENTIQIPAGTLQGDVYTKGRPEYLNYGTIGWIIAHELTHGFDTVGRHFDATENLFDWWDSFTKEEYLKKAQCIIDQFSNYTAEEVGLNLNGKNTVGENIADNGGIKEAYYAYEDYEKQNGVQPNLPGLSYNSRQLFWIGAANMWCWKYRPEYLKKLIITNVHSPAEFRTIGSFSNMPEFSKDFNCPLGSKMNPVKKCTVW